MDNEIKLTINISDQLLGKLLHAMQKPNAMGIPMQALLGMAMQPPVKESPSPVKEKQPIGFKA